MIIFLPLIISLTLLIFFVTYALAGLSAAPWVPTRQKDVERFINIANIKPDDKVYDLGCGDGRLILAAAEIGAKSVGFEISLFPYLVAKVTKLARRLDNCQIIYKSFWSANLSDADIIYVFLMPHVNRRIINKLEKELKPGTKIISYTFPIEGWKPEKIDHVDQRANIFYIKDNINIFYVLIGLNKKTRRLCLYGFFNLNQYSS